MNIEIGEKALVTTDSWFLAPDGRQYRAAFGTVHGCKTAEDTLGIKPNGRSTNWFLEIGCLTIAGCQIHYAIRTDDCSNAPAQDWNSDAANGIKIYERPSSIFFADIA